MPSPAWSKAVTLVMPLARVDLATVERLKLGLVRRIVDRLKAWIVVGDGAGITCALDVVLAAHGVDAGTLAADIAGHQHQIGQALHILHAADVFGDAQRVVDGPARPRRRVEPLPRCRQPARR